MPHTSLTPLTSGKSVKTEYEPTENALCRKDELMNTNYDDLIRFSPDGLIHDNKRLVELQRLPLHRKIGITISRITEWYNHFNGNVYVSISGGKDSTVLWDIVHKLFPDVPAVFSNTGLEYPEIQQFAKSICDDVVSPKMSFTEVIKTYGYPLISKEISEAIYYARRNTPPRREAEWKRLELTGNRPAIKRADYWADKQSGSDSNSWGKDQLVQGSTTGTAKSYPPPCRTYNLSKANRTTRRETRPIYCGC